VAKPARCRRLPRWCVQSGGGTRFTTGHRRSHQRGVLSTMSETARRSLFGQFIYTALSGDYRTTAALGPHPLIVRVPVGGCRVTGRARPFHKTRQQFFSQLRLFRSDKHRTVRQHQRPRSRRGRVSIRPARISHARRRSAVSSCDVLSLCKLLCCLFSAFSCGEHRPINQTRRVLSDQNRTPLPTTAIEKPRQRGLTTISCPPLVFPLPPHPCTAADTFCGRAARAGRLPEIRCRRRPDISARSDLRSVFSSEPFTSRHPARPTDDRQSDRRNVSRPACALTARPDDPAPQFSGTLTSVSVVAI
jgi:hypothetical protein